RSTTAARYCGSANASGIAALVPSAAAPGASPDGADSMPRSLAVRVFGPRAIDSDQDDVSRRCAPRLAAPSYGVRARPTRFAGGEVSTSSRTHRGDPDQGRRTSGVPKRTGKILTTFRDLGVIPEIADALERAGIVTPFPIQEMTLSVALAGTDLIGQA